MLDGGYDEQQHSFAAAIVDFCRRRSALPPEAGLDREYWRGLGELGVLGLTSPDSGAQPLDVVAAHEALGAGGGPGPLWATALAAAVLAEPERTALGTGEFVVAIGPVELMPWVGTAELLLDDVDLGPDGGSLWPCRDVVVERELTRLDFEPAARIRCGHGEAIRVSAAAIGLADLARAAYLVGAAGRVLVDAAAYVATRRQFRRPLSQFQAVTHPLAECHARVGAAAALVRRAASRLADEPTRSDCAVALGSAARAARTAVYQAHQAYGGIGFAQEGPLYWLGARIGQLSAEAEQRWRTRPLTEVLLER